MIYFLARLMSISRFYMFVLLFLSFFKATEFTPKISELEIKLLVSEITEKYGSYESS